MTKSKGIGKHIRVFMDLPEKGEVWVGTILLDRKNELGKIAADFAYHPNYKGPALDPINLPAPSSSKEFRRITPPVSDDGYCHLVMHQVFRDTMPGAWGDQVLSDHFPEYAKMTAAERLYWLGSRTANGLRFQCYESIMTESPIRGIEKLREIERKAIDYIQYKRDPDPSKTDQEVQEITRFLDAKDGSLWSVTSEGGSRPKAKYMDGAQEFLVKFTDPKENANTARIEQAMLILSAEAGLATPSCAVFLSEEKGRDMFVVERFDRIGDGQWHKVSFAALTGKDNAVFNRGSVDYTDMVKAIRVASGNPEADVEELYGRMVMTVAGNLTDNHVKNYEMMLGDDLKYRLAPQFDLVPTPHDTQFSTTISRYPRRSMIAGDLENLKFFEKTAKDFGIPTDKAMKIAARVLSVMQRADQIMADCGVPERDKNAILKMMDLKLLQRTVDSINIALHQDVGDLKSMNVTAKDFSDRLGHWQTRKLDDGLGLGS